MGLYDDAMKRVGTGRYLKLDAGRKKIRILDHPYVSNRPGFNPEDAVRTVFTWPVWNYDEQRVQVLEQGATIFKQVGAIIDEWGEDMPMNCDLVITTKGAGREVKRTVVATPHAGTMPPVSVLKKDPNYPDIAELSKGVPLASFAKGDEPVTAVQEPKKADTVLEDLDDAEINLDDIPF